MLRLKVFLKNGQKKSVAIENKKKCAGWLNLLHEDWNLIEIQYEGKTISVVSKMDLEEWIKKNG